LQNISAMSRIRPLTARPAPQW